MPEMTGYDTEDRYYATSYKQGGKTVYSIDLSLAGVAATVPRPDPRRLTEGNRQINESHARAFGTYVRENVNWVAPALLLRASNIFKFKEEKVIGGIQFGVLSVPRLARTDLKILDGQHRILGLHHAVEDIASELEKHRSLLAAARNQDNPELVKRYQAEIKDLEAQRARLDRERISVQIYLVDDTGEFKQMFVDIADNAKGITSTIRARFDHRKVVNRALDTVLRNALLDGRVDMQQDRIGGASRNLVGAKHVAEIIRTVTVGISGRVSRRQETELQEAELAERANNFLDTLTEGFSVLNDLIEGKCTPEQLRKTSLLGSSTMLRVMAGVYYELARERSDDDIAGFFAKLSPHMTAPVTDDSPWVRIEGEVFSAGAVAPRARRQDLVTLTQAIVEWARSEPEWMEAA